MSLAGGLEQAGQTVDSAVGGRGCRGHIGDSLIKVAFWGICDIKYDPRQPVGQRVKLLELGDGRSSRFSHHGRPIKDKFDREYCMEKSPPPIKRSVMVENKKFTHDMFLREGFLHLRPLTASYPRRYHPELAVRILQDLELGNDDAVVLKLCNRSRGAGIVVVPGRPEELDGALWRLLNPPCKEAVPDWLTTHVPWALNQHPADVLEEQCLHWWSNECPVFIVERLCKSVPVAKHEDSDQRFDGTMRVAFALHRKPTTGTYSHMYMYSDGPHGQIKPFEIDWLGGYWKLPKTETSETAQGCSLEQLHERVVSSFNSVDKRTAEVPQEQLEEVYEALTPALPVIFHTGAFGVPMIMGIYKKDDPLFCAFALARVAATMRQSDKAKAMGLFEVAEKMVHPWTSGSAEDLPERSLLSYIRRNMGVCNCIHNNLEGARTRFGEARDAHPMNSTAHYLLGYCQQEDRALSLAIRDFLCSIALDPDFKAPYLALGSCFLLKKDWEAAINASAACLRRNPDAPEAQFIIGQAIYHILASRGGSLGEEAEDLRRKAVAALEIAKERMPKHWQEVDNRMVDYLLADEAARKEHKPVPIHTWNIPAWRP